MKKYLVPAAFALALGAPALAADDPATAAAPTVSLGSLLDSGYEIKSVMPISDEDQKAVWPDDKVAPFLMLILQKGASIASCPIATSSVVNMAQATFANAALCRKR